MIFHEKTKDIEDPYEQYHVLCGIEEEFLIVKKDGTLIEAADEMMQEAADILDNDPDRLENLKIKIRSLDAEPNPSQIEYVTLPLPPEALEEAVFSGRKLLIDAADRLGVKILAQSLHPIQSDPHPIVGTHINVSTMKKGNVMKPDDLRTVYNYFWNYLPELIGMTANSPVYRGEEKDIASNRLAKSNVLKANGPAKIEIPDKGPALIRRRYYGRMRYNLKIGSGEDEFAKDVIANSKGQRLVDITPRGPSTNIGDDKDESPSRNRVEIRIVDVQQDPQDLLDLAYLCCASALHAVYLDKSGYLKTDSYHQENAENAVRNGRKAGLRRAENKKESLEESLTRWMEETKKYQDYLGLEIKNLPKEKLQKAPLQRGLKVNFQTKQLEQLRQQGRNYAKIRLNKSRIVSDERGNRYKVSGGNSINGTISADYSLDYEEQNKIITHYTNVKIVNTLEVQGLQIPLREDDEIISTMSQRDYLTRRLFGPFGF
ncbi:MAG: putative metal-dependent hydrolase of the TIM-barrel fold [Promethearchaeota archaeon]|nr:MAG: putative metal-dependent hydrolase of the TIM-barrel fold [Candidatus Lokiarchaeota archaeon]